MVIGIGFKEPEDKSGFRECVRVISKGCFIIRLEQEEDERSFERD